MSAGVFNANVLYVTTENLSVFVDEFDLINVGHYTFDIDITKLFFGIYKHK